MNAVSAELLVPGFDDPGERAQRIFRTVLEAMARPGSVHTVDTGLDAVDPLYPATVGFVFSFLDADTPVWLDAAADRPAVRDNLRFHCGCPMVDDPAAAAFAVVIDPGAMPGLAEFRSGDDLYPDRSTTLIVQVEGFDCRERLALSGPGIEHRRMLGVEGLPESFADQWAANGALYPAGVDLVITAGTRLAALPRSTRVGTG